jgi:flagellar motility protein MotE (MotC chaperone)
MKRYSCRWPALLLFVILLLRALPSSAAPETDPSSVEERRLKASIHQELIRLRQKEKMLDAKEMELKTLSREVDKKLEELKKARAEINGLLERKQELETQKARALSKMYEKMEPAGAAGLLVSLEKGLAIAILDGMSAKSAGRVLNNMDPETAASLSTSFSRLGE